MFDFLLHKYVFVTDPVLSTVSQVLGEMREEQTSSPFPPGEQS